MPAKCAPLLVIAAVVSVLTATSGHAAESVESLMMVGDDGAAATIVTPDDADSWTLMAAGWLRDYVEKVTGAKLSIVVESKAPPGTIICVGHTKLAAEAGVTTDELKFDGCKMVVRGRMLFLIGRDVPPLHQSSAAAPNPVREPWDYTSIILKGHGEPARLGAKGTCRAITRFLEQFCGVRWLAPATRGTFIPARRSITVAGDLNDTFEPWMAYHTNRVIYGDPRSEPAAYANNYRMAVKLYTRGGHTYNVWVPSSEYFDEHPEYFALINGTRTGVGNHLCASNPQVRRIILGAIESRFETGYDLVALGQSDGYTPCECDPCRTMANHTGARDAEGRLDIEHSGEPMLDLARWVAEQCVDKHPGKYIHMLVYGPTSAPSNKIESFPPNVMFEFASSASPQMIRRWEGRSATGGTVYTPWHWTDYGIGLGLKLGYTEAAQLMREYRELGIIGIHSGGGQCWGLQGPTYYTFGKMMGDPELDPEQLLMEYCAGLYGQAANEMAAFFRELHKQSDYPLLFKMQITAMERYPLYYPPERLEKLDELLSVAEDKAESDDQRNWIQTTRDELDFIRLVANALAIYKDYRQSGDPGLVAPLRQAVAEFDEYRKRIVNYGGRYATNYFPGHGILSCALSHGQGGSGYGSDWREVKQRVNLSDLSGSSIGQGALAIDKPFTLDFDQEDIDGSLHVRYTAEAIAADGKMDESQWQSAQPVFMPGARGTQVRALYDDRNLYVAFICDEPSPNGPAGQDIVRDNPIYFMDVVELFVNPTALSQNQTYYQFLAGASDSAIYDLRGGDDGPGSQDKTWNAPNFRYGFHDDRSRKKWTIEMIVPFADINTKAPEHGDVWLGNLARGSGGQGLAQWSRGGTPGFGNPKSFNKFRFVKDD